MLIKLTHGGLMTEIHAKSILKIKQTRSQLLFLPFYPSEVGWKETPYLKLSEEKYTIPKHFEYYLKFSQNNLFKYDGTTQFRNHSFTGFIFYAK